METTVFDEGFGSLSDKFIMRGQEGIGIGEMKGLDKEALVFSIMLQRFDNKDITLKR